MHEKALRMHVAYKLNFVNFHFFSIYSCTDFQQLQPHIFKLELHRKNAGGKLYLRTIKKITDKYTKTRYKNN